MSLDPALRSRSQPSVKVTSKKPAHHEIAHHAKVYCSFVQSDVKL